MSVAAYSDISLQPVTVPTQPVETIRSVLRREVAVILRDNLPDLAMAPTDKIYDRVLGDPVLLDQAFRLLRNKPELFKDVVTTPQRLLPQSDDEALWCGRTLGEAVALVVRACARRYFHDRLKGPANPVRFAPRVGFFKSMGVAMGLLDPPKPPRRKAAPNPGDRLYGAMRDLLLYDWQVPLIPAYSTLSPELVRSLGEKLLEYRDPLKVQLLSEHSTEAALVDGKTPLMMSGASRLMSAGSDSINAEVLWSVCQKMRMAALFPGSDTADMRKAVSMVAAASPQALNILMPVLGDDIRLFTLYLFTVYGKFGPIRFRQVLGAQCQTWVVEAMAKRIAQEPRLSGTHEEMKNLIETWLEEPLGALIRDEEQKNSMLNALGNINSQPPVGRASKT